MLRELTVRNVKRFDERGVTVRPARITVFIGANGTGKSTLPQLLLLLKQSLGQERLAFDGSAIRIGAPRDVVHDHDVRRKIGVELTWEYDGFQVPPEGTLEATLPVRGGYTYAATFDEGRLERHTAHLGDSHGGVRAAWSLLGQEIKPEELGVQDVVTIRLATSNTVGVGVRLGGSHADSPEQAEPILRATRSLVDVPRRMLENTYLIPAIRGFDRLSYQAWSGQMPGDLTAVEGPDERSRLIAATLAAYPELGDQVANHVNAVLEGESLRFWTRTVEGRHQGEFVRGHRNINLFNEAFGANQLVALFLWLVKAPAESLVAIEEPEIHLHPKAQAALARELNRVSREQTKQLMITTHSEHILMGLLSQVARGELDAADLAVYEFRGEDGTSRAEALAVNAAGQIAGGLRGLMEVELEAMGDLIGAHFRR